MDSTAAQAIARNPILHQKTKHFEIDLHTIRERILHGDIALCHILGAENVADAFTKPLAGPRFNHLMSKLGLLIKCACMVTHLGFAIAPTFTPFPFFLFWASSFFLRYSF